VFALAANTGSFVTTAQTGLYAPAAGTGNFVIFSGTNLLATRGAGNFGTSSICSALVGGYNNNINSNTATIVGGCNNSITTSSSNNTIVGGLNNVSNANNGVVVGGLANSISTYTSSYAGVFAGNNNTSDGYQAVIVGGYNNRVNTCSCQSAVISSSTSRVSGCRAVIIGGYNNCITGFDSSVILGGQNIVADANNTAYSNNFCSINGKYYGDASALTGLATGSFITTGMTGAFGSAGYVSTGATGVFVTTGQTGVFALAANTGAFVTSGQTGNFITTFQTGAFGGAGVDLSDYVTYSDLQYLGKPEKYSLFNCGFIVGSDFVNSGSLTVAFNAGLSCSEYSSNNNFIASTNFSLISSGATNNGIIGGLYNEISDNVSNSVILGGQYITGTSNNTAYANNYCAISGKYYGDGSALTGFVAQVNKCQILAKNTTPFDICAITRVASSYIGSDRIVAEQGNGRFYLCDHNDNSADDCNLYTILNNGYCVAQFSAMIVGHAVYGGSNAFTTSIKIDGIANSYGVLTQNKMIQHQAFETDDACVIVENQSLKIYITGAQTGMRWGARLDIVGMEGYD
jgi:hypothetical protein